MATPLFFPPIQYLARLPQGNSIGLRTLCEQAGVTCRASGAWCDRQVSWETGDALRIFVATAASRQRIFCWLISYRISTDAERAGDNPDSPNWRQTIAEKRQPFGAVLFWNNGNERSQSDKTPIRFILVRRPPREHISHA